MIEVNTITLGLFGTNTYLVKKDDGSSFLIDPNDNSNQLLAQIKETPKAIVLTHEHIDHILGVSSIINKFGEIPIFCSQETKNILSNTNDILRQTNKIHKQLTQLYKNPIKDLSKYNFSVLKEGEDIFGFTILETPGHSIGSICLHNKTEKILFSGDLLFQNGYGRYDLEGGNYSTLKESLKRILDLDGDTLVYPGHGASTYIKLEQQTLFL